MWIQQWPQDCWPKATRDEAPGSQESPSPGSDDVAALTRIDPGSLTGGGALTSSLPFVA